jgi:hypothetical protein
MYEKQEICSNVIQFIYLGAEQPSIGLTEGNINHGEMMLDQFSSCVPWRDGRSITPMSRISICAVRVRIPGEELQTHLAGTPVAKSSAI